MKPRLQLLATCLLAAALLNFLPGAFADGLLSGQVTRASDGTPIEGAHVKVLSDYNYSVAGTAITDADGYYSVTLSPGTYVAQAKVSDSSECLTPVTYDGLIGMFWDGTNYIHAERIQVSDNDTTENIDFALPSGGLITGTVTDASNNAPLANIRVVATRQYTSSSYGTAYTDANGVYTLCIPAGDYILHAQSNEPPYLHGTITYDNLPGLPWSGDNWDNATILTIAGESTTEDINFALPPRGVITGTALASGENTPLGGCTVHIFDHQGYPVSNTFVEYEGQYALGELVAGEYYAVLVPSEGACFSPQLFEDLLYEGPDFNTTPPPYTEVLNGTPIQVTAGEATTDIDFLPDVSPPSVAGSVTAQDTGDPLYYCVIMFEPTTDDSDDSFSAYPDSDGQFELCMPPGDYYTLAFWIGGGETCYRSLVYGGQPFWGLGDLTPELIQTGTPITINPDQDTLQLDFELPGCSVFPDCVNNGFRQTLAPPDPVSLSQFGHAVALEGDAAIVGAPIAWSAHAFRRVNGTWQPHTVLDPPEIDPQSFHGYAVAIKNNIALVGAPNYENQGDCNSGFGAVFVFRYEADEWHYQTMLQPDNLEPGNFFGGRIAFDGTRAAIGAPGNLDSPDLNTAGAVYFYTLTDAGWQLMQEIAAPEGALGDKFGGALALVENTLVIGAPGDDESDTEAGAAYVYGYADDTWSLNQKLVSPLPEPEAWFGHGRIGLDADQLLIGEPGYGQPANGQPVSRPGSAHLFYLDQGLWKHETTLVAADGEPGDMFGFTVDIRDSILAIGAVNAEHRMPPSFLGRGDGRGAVYIFDRDGDNWLASSKLLASGPDPGDDACPGNGSFGADLTLAPNEVLVGETGINMMLMSTYPGRAYTFPLGNGEDCNNNGTPDHWDIANGISRDCQANGIPDECERDSDNDGIIDDCDQCPNDPFKTNPGACGCNNPETDNDNDGTPDCADECPADPDKFEPGSCGCGFPDTDRDADGTPDCQDTCPDDPTKIEPGECGCGFELQTWYEDFDNDGYGNETSMIDACTQPVGYVTEPGDCDDRDATVNPGAGNCATDDNDDTIDTTADLPIDVNGPDEQSEEDIPCSDADADGVCDDDDQCPNTDPNTLVDDTGCATTTPGTLCPMSSALILGFTLVGLTRRRTTNSHP